MTIPQYLWYAPVHPLARRSTDHERDQALAMLTAALQRGQLTIEEHAQRAEAALRSRTVGDLVLLTQDVLPPPPQPAPPGLPRVVPRSSSMPDASLVTGIAGLVLFPIFLGGLVAIVLGMVALAEVRGGAALPSHRPRAVAGVATGVLALLAGLVFYAFV
jgi:hypothetical protein